MAIYRLLKNSTLEPEEISRITEAYEQALHTLCVKDRDDPLTEMIAKKITRTGVHDAAQLSALAISEQFARIEEQGLEAWLGDRLR
jgi:hypothetical protein